MAGNIIGQPIKPIIGEQIDLRQKIHGAGYNENSLQRSPEVLNFLNNRNAWIKLASGVSLDDGERLKDLAKFETENYFTENDINSLLGKNLAKNYILFNTMQSLTQGAERTVNDSVTTQTRAATYQNRSGVRNTNSWNGSQDKIYGGIGGNSKGLQPVPGIIDVNVESINRGSIRKANVTLKAYNKFQFGIIEILYLKLGYIMMLEWGWDRFIDGIDNNNKPIIKNVESTIIENQWFKDKHYTQLEMLQNINGFVDLYKGNYDGFFGKVNNFSWTLNQDGTYDITINLITLGSVVESLQVIVPSSPITSSELKRRKEALAKVYQIKLEDDGEGNENNSVITNLGTDRLTSFFAGQIETFFTQKLENNKDYYFLPNAVGAIDNSNEKAAVKANRKKIPFTSRYYIRFGKLLDIIENNVVLRVVNGDSFKESIVTFEKSEEFTRINYEPNLIPLDPSICIFKPVYTEELGITDTITLPNFKFCKDFAVEKDNVFYGKLMNVYLNMNFVADVLNKNKNDKNELDLFNFLQKILSGINRCMGNVCELDVSLKNDRVIYFLDENPISGYDLVFPPKTKEPTFNIIGYTPDKGSSFVTDFNFQTKITPKLMTQISIGATSAGSETNALSAVGYQNWNAGLTNRFEEKYESGPLARYVPPTKEEVTTPEEAYYEEVYNDFKEKSTWSLIPPSYFWTYKGYTKNYGTDFTSFWNSRKTNMEDDGLRDLVIASAKDIDTKLASEGIEVITDGEKMNDYPTYLLDGFGGTGTKKIEVKVSRREREAKLKENRKARREGTLTGSILEGEGLSTKLVDQKVASGDALYWYSSDNPEFVDRGYNVFKNYKATLDQYQYEVANKTTGTTGFIPVTLGIEFEGLGGLKIYNKIKVNQKSLPASYPKALKFIIDGINHTIGDNDWKTDISTISQPITTKPTKRKITKTKTITVPFQNSSGVVKEFTGPEEQAVTLLKKISLKAPSNNGLCYYPEETDKIQITLHHTAILGASVEAVVNSFTRKSNHVSTHFIINRDGDYDQLFPLKYWGNHVGSKRAGNSYLQKSTISIELEGMGYLKAVGRVTNGKGEFYKTAKFKQGSRIVTYKQLAGGQPDPAVARPYKMKSDGSLVPATSYKDSRYYHAYTKAQLDRLKQVLKQIQKEYPNITIGSQYSGGNGFYEQFPSGKKLSETAFSFNRGTFTHNSYRTDKSDVFPQKELIELLQEFS